MCFFNARSFGLCHKYPKKNFHEKEILNDMENIFRNVSEAESELTEFDGEGDHVHLLINYPPKNCNFKTCSLLKRCFFTIIRKKEYPTIRNSLWGNHLWSPSYFASSCGGAPSGNHSEVYQQQETPN